MTPDTTIKRGDSGKVLSGQFTDANGNVDCTGNTSRKLFMKNLMTDAVKINGANFSVTNGGAWTYTMQAADVDTAGWYKLELEIILVGGQKATFPTNFTDPFHIILVQDDLG